MMHDLIFKLHNASLCVVWAIIGMTLICIVLVVVSIVEVVSRIKKTIIMR